MTLILSEDWVQHRHTVFVWTGISNRHQARKYASLALQHVLGAVSAVPVLLVLHACRAPIASYRGARVCVRLGIMRLIPMLNSVRCVITSVGLARLFLPIVPVAVHHCSESFQETPVPVWTGTSNRLKLASALHATQAVRLVMVQLLVLPATQSLGSIKWTQATYAHVRQHNTTTQPKVSAWHVR